MAAKNIAPGSGAFHRDNKTPGRGVFGFKRTPSNRCYWCEQRMSASPNRNYTGIKIGQDKQEFFNRQVVCLAHHVCPQSDDEGDQLCQ